MLRRLAREEATADALVDALERDGVVCVERWLDRPEVAALRAELASVLAATPTGRNEFEGYATRRVYNLFAKVRGFDRLAIDPVLGEVLERTIGPCQLSAPVAIEIGPGNPAQVLHRDDSIYPLPWPHQEVVLNTMWALDDFTVDNGATRFLPGSARRAVEVGPADEARCVPATMPAGSVLFYVGTLVHGGGANRTDRPRLGVILEYVAAWLRAQENHVVGVGPDLAAALPERLQELLGWNVYPPFVGYVDGRHPRRFLPS